MLRRYAAHIVALLLIVLVAGACLVRTSSRPAPRRGGPVYVEKHKHKKVKKVKHRKHKH